MKITIRIALVFCILAFVAPCLQAEDTFQPQGTALRKLERGGANLLLGGMEMVRCLREPDQGQFYMPWFVGLGKGFYHTGRRTLVGIYEVLSFPIPVPQDYLPVIGPEFVWEYPKAKDQE